MILPDDTQRLTPPETPQAKSSAPPPPPPRAITPSRLPLEQLVEYVGGPGATYSYLPYTHRVVVRTADCNMLFGEGATERAALLDAALRAIK